MEVAQAAELTGLSKDAIRGRIRRGALASKVHKGRHRIPLGELRRQGLLVERERYTRLLERAESLEAELRAARESRQHAERERRKLEDTLRLVWGMVRQKEQQISQLETGRRAGVKIRWPWRRSTSRTSRQRFGLIRGSG